MSLSVVRKQIITVGGTPASGKSTASKGVAKMLGYRHFSSGDMMRRLGAEQGLDILATNHAAASDEKLDRLVDGELTRINREEELMVVDSRMGWHFIPGSLRVFLDVPFTVAAERIIADSDEQRRHTENIPDDAGQYAERLKARQELESLRYKSKYGVDPFDHRNYDVTVNTEHVPARGVLGVVMSAYTSRALDLD